MKTETLFSIFEILGDILAKIERKCWFSSKLQKTTIIQSYLLLFWRLLSKNYLSSIAFSQLMAPEL